MPAKVTIPHSKNGAHAAASDFTFEVVARLLRGVGLESLHHLAIGSGLASSVIVEQLAGGEGSVGSLRFDGFCRIAGRRRRR
ncbi:MAG: hypothetical protein OSB70_16510 [Myxococcota bacterium]|nr:hypothetical protein [Myxococcota bacterium]